MKLQPYVHFEGRCDEAIEFYKTAIGAKVTMLMRFNQCSEPMSNMNPAMGEKVMHANLMIGDSELLVSDGHCRGEANFAGFELTLNVATEAEAEKLFGALAEGGKVMMPLAKTFFSPKFGMLTDRFGIAWMVIVQ
ncbi:MAG TPA: VOC family protein [Pirellulales bacterium]|jgi:PhnB protein|nr:VOC family protein [Pirellulales bacterium]